MTAIPENTDHLRLEYQQLCENMRHYGNMRFAQLTLYFALTSGLIVLLYGARATHHPIQRLVFQILGVVGAVAFGVMEERAGDYWHCFQQRALKIERALGLKQFTDCRPPLWWLRREWGLPRHLTATNACRILLWGGAIAWPIAAMLERVTPVMPALSNDSSSVPYTSFRMLDLCIVLIAAYGAALSTILGVLEWRRRKPRLVVSLDEIRFRPLEGETKRTFWIVVRNPSERNVTLQSIVICHKTDFSWSGVDENGKPLRLPYELAPQSRFEARFNAEHVAESLCESGFAAKVKVHALCVDALDRKYQSKAQDFDLQWDWEAEAAGNDPEQSRP